MNACMKNPYQRGLITVAGLVGLGLLATLAAGGLAIAGLAAAGFAWFGLSFTILFSLIFVIAWWMGARQMRQAEVFLASERVLARWTYSDAEWRQLREMTWQEEKGDWKVQLGCLTFLFALTGLLAGGMIGLEEGLLETITNAIAGLLVGGLVGAALGVVVAGGNYWGARRAYADAEPGAAALGINEFYTSGDYFRGDGRSSYIQEARLERGVWTTLHLLTIMPPRPRMPSEEEWIIPVPARCVPQVEAILERLAQSQTDE